MFYWDASFLSMTEYQDDNSFTLYLTIIFCVINFPPFCMADKI